MKTIFEAKNELTEYLGTKWDLLNKDGYFDKQIFTCSEEKEINAKKAFNFIWSSLQVADRSHNVKRITLLDGDVVDVSKCADISDKLEFIKSIVDQISMPDSAQ